MSRHQPYYPSAVADARLPFFLALGAAASVGFAVGAAAIGALAIGRMAVGRLAVGRASLGEVEIDKLTVRKLTVLEP